MQTYIHTMQSKCSEVKNESLSTGQPYRIRNVIISVTHRVVDVSLRPHHVMFLIDDFGSTEHVQILHHVLLYVCQRGDLREIT